MKTQKTAGILKILLREMCKSICDIFIPAFYMTISLALIFQRLNVSQRVLFFR